MRPSSVSPFTGHHLPFIGFSFTENRYVGTAQSLFFLVVYVDRITRVTISKGLNFLSFYLLLFI